MDNSKKDRSRWSSWFSDSVLRLPFHLMGDTNPKLHPPILLRSQNRTPSFSLHHAPDGDPPEPTTNYYSYASIVSLAKVDPTAAVRAMLQHAESDPAEDPTQYVEAALRAWRNLLLEEAVELQEALRYWNIRSERPWLAWIETGNFQLSLADHHVMVTTHVITLQAVLARRCAAVGELQQHVLQAGWRRGVAQWAVLVGWSAREVTTAAGSDAQYHAIGGASPGPASRVMVGKEDGDGIFVDDPALVEAWTRDAMTLIRKQVERAGMLGLGWDTDRDVYDEEEGGTSFVEEITELLDLMQKASRIQRQRRLEKLRGYSWLRRNWYILAGSVPVVWTLGRRLRFKGSLSLVLSKVAALVRERVAEPLTSIFREIWRGRETFSDKKASHAAVESLKKMIKSWLDETYPDMPVKERDRMAEAMDLRLLEKKKEESMKTFYEINNVIRMSFIEMQYMKKEMMHALHAMDEMMSANDINMNLAAITPVAMLGYLSVRIFRFCFYALLKLGKSREETYAYFRNVITDIERLLVMRYNPPNSTGPSVLGSDDLGMLMLLIHECRSILRTDHRRFSTSISRSVSEDLAELAGERGPVSVEQQLSIVGRMVRTYPFLKVISTGHRFEFHQHWRQ